MLISARTHPFGQSGAYNSAQNGPSFGAGFDLFVDAPLLFASSFLASFGAASDFGKDLAKYPGPQFGQFAIGRIEVFTVASPVPEASTAMMLFGGLAALALVSDPAPVLTPATSFERRPRLASPQDVECSGWRSIAAVSGTSGCWA